MRSAWNNSTRAPNIDPVLSLPGLQPVIGLIPSDFGERNNSGSSSIYCNRGTKASQEATNVPDLLSEKEQYPIQAVLLQPSLGSAGRRNSVWSSWGHQEHKALAFTKNYGNDTLSKSHCLPQPNVEREKPKWEGKEAEILCD